MNYKILAVSGVVTVGVVSLIIAIADRPGDAEQNAVHPMESVAVEAPSASAYIAREPAPPSEMAAPAGTEAMNDIADLDSANGRITGLPRIAYVFGYGFRLPASTVKAVQDRHADMCETRGPKVCRVIAMEQDSADDAAYSGSLHLAVAAPLARSFGKELTSAAHNAEGELVSSSIDGEDLSKQMVDTEARLRARTVLRDRLMEVLQSRRGTVAELVEAERGVAKVNEEIDQARSWLAEMNGRVDFTQMHITYSTGAALVQTGGFAEPTTDVFGEVGPTLGAMLGALVRLLTFLLPLAVIAWLARAGWRRLGRPGSDLLRRSQFEPGEIPA